MAAKPWLVVPLELAVADKTYTVEPIEYAGGLALLEVLSGKSKEIKKNSPNEVLFRLVMGGTWDEMLEDRVPFNVMFRAGMSAVQYQVALVSDLTNEQAVEAGERMWESGIDPEALAATMAAQTRKPAASKRSRSTASVNATRSPASTKPTTSLPGTQRRSSRPKADQSDGTNSPSSGR